MGLGECGEHAGGTSAGLHSLLEFLDGGPELPLLQESQSETFVRPGGGRLQFQCPQILTGCLVVLTFEVLGLSHLDICISGGGHFAEEALRVL